MRIWATAGSNLSGRRIIDKIPANFLYLGLIEWMFPRARVLHCRRDRLDICLSCYFQNFDSQPWSFDLDNIASYYRDYDRIVGHWQRTLGLSITDVTYEDLVTDQETHSRKILEACELEWDPRVSRLALVGVLSPLPAASKCDSRSVGRAANYAAHLGPLIERTK